MSGQRRKRWETAKATHHTGQSLAETELGAGGLGGEPHQAYLPGLAVPTLGGTPGQEAGSGRGGPLDAGDLLPYAERTYDLQELGRRLLRPSRARAPNPLLRQAPERSRSQGHARTRRRCLTEIFRAETGQLDFAGQPGSSRRATSTLGRSLRASGTLVRSAQPHDD